MVPHVRGTLESDRHSRVDLHPELNHSAVLEQSLHLMTPHHKNQAQTEEKWVAPHSRGEKGIWAYQSLYREGELNIKRRKVEVSIQCCRVKKVASAGGNTSGIDRGSVIAVPR